MKRNVNSQMIFRLLEAFYPTSLLCGMLFIPKEYDFQGFHTSGLPEAINLGLFQELYDHTTSIVI